MSELLSRYVNRKRAIVAGALALAGGGAAIGLYEASKEDYCYPQRESDPYLGDPQADPNNQSTWIRGVEAETDIPEDAKELRAGYTDPGDNWHDSQWIDPGLAERIALSIGNFEVRFRIQAKIPEDSASCDEPLDVTFTRKPYRQIIREGGIDPFQR